MNIQPGSGYGFSSSAYGFTFDTGKSPFLEDAGAIASNDHPFRISLAGSVTTPAEPGEGEPTTTYYFHCTPGTVNNLDPVMVDPNEGTKKLNTKPKLKAKLEFDPETNYSYVTLTCGVHLADPTIYPETNPENAQYPLVSSFSFVFDSDDDVGAIILASAYKDPETNSITLWQYVTGSLWTDRIKLSGIDAKYYFARI